jgi:hypothetical protein
MAQVARRYLVKLTILPGSFETPYPGPFLSFAEGLGQRTYPYVEDIFFLVSRLFELSDGFSVSLVCWRFNVDREVHVTAGLETGATNHG